MKDACGEGDAAGEIVPVAMAGYLSLDESADAFDEIEVGTGGRKPEQCDVWRLPHQPVPERCRRVVGGVVHDQHQWVGGPPLDQRLDKFPKGGRGCAIMDRRDHLTGTIVQRAKDGYSLIDSCGGNTLH